METETNKPKRIPLVFYGTISEETSTLLKAFGYQVVIGNGDFNNVVTHKENGEWQYSIGISVPGYIKERLTDALMFVALASINEDNDLYQIFIKDVPVNIPAIGLHIPAGSPVISLTEKYQDFGDNESGFHKATKDEIINLIRKDKQTRNLIHGFFYHTVLEDYNKKKEGIEFASSLPTDNEFDIEEGNATLLSCETESNNEEDFKKKYLTLLKKYDYQLKSHNKLLNLTNELMGKIRDMVMVHENMSNVIRLLSEEPNSLTKDEKEQIVQRFANIKTIEESNDLYRSIKKEIEERRNTSSTNETNPQRSVHMNDNVQKSSKPRPKVYISLPISGREEEARKECKETKEWLERRFPEIEFISPFEITTETEMPYSYYMGRDVEALLECESVIFLDGWNESKGCRAEHYLAEVYDKKIIYMVNIREALQLLP